MLTRAIGAWLAAAALFWVSPGEAVQVVAKVTPVAKVITLLEKLEVQVGTEGKKEAAAYDKYACFCKEQLDDKLYAIEKSTKRIHRLEAEIQELDAEIMSLAQEISVLAVKIQDLQVEIEERKKVRAEEHFTYKHQEADAAGAIDSAKRAIDALSESKGQLGGKTKKDADVALVQLRAFSRRALTSVDSLALSASQLQSLSKMAGEPGKAYEYSYSSNDVIATIKTLHTTFKSRKAKLDQDEFDKKTAHESDVLHLTNGMKFAQKEKGEMEKLSAEKSETKNLRETDRSQEMKDETADRNFQAVLVKQCEDKAQLFDQRSSARSDELHVVSNAIEALKTGVAPNYKANKKLVGLQRRGASRAVSFLQQGRTTRGHGAQATAMRKAFALLDGSQHKLGSGILSAALLKVRSSEDHFVKVRSIITDLITRLEEQAKSEADLKAFCDQGMEKATMSRDKAAESIEKTKADIKKLKAALAMRKGEVADLSEGIASNMKALKEATEVRGEEERDNEGTLEDAGEGREAVEMALQMLKEFYEGSFVQRSARSAYVPPNSDREGNTVGDLAPEIFDEDYAGTQDASKGIIGMLEVILADFERTSDQVQSNEATASAAFKDFRTENAEDTDDKEQSKMVKEDEIAKLGDDLIMQRDALGEHEKDHKLALSELEGLKETCVDSPETHEEKVAKREKEIEALKQAHDILENWQSSGE